MTTIQEALNKLIEQETYDDATPNTSLVINDLIQDEEEAIDGYDKAITKLSGNDYAIAVFNHIKEEEQKHIMELRELLDRKES